MEKEKKREISPEEIRAHIERRGFVQRSSLRLPRRKLNWVEAKAELEGLPWPERSRSPGW
jgi:hypothetical protein